MSLHQMARRIAATKSAVIITGNPRYITGNPLANAFYDEIRRILTYAGYSVSFDPGEPYTEPPPADLWVGHSRGADRLRFAPQGTKTIALGSKRGLFHPDDNTLEHFGVEPNEHHYELTDEMRTALLSA